MSQAVLIGRLKQARPKSPVHLEPSVDDDASNIFDVLRDCVVFFVSVVSVVPHSFNPASLQSSIGAISAFTAVDRAARAALGLRRWSSRRRLQAS